MGGIVRIQPSTLRQRVLGYRSVQVLEYVRQEVTATGRPPSYSMIAEALDIASKGEVCNIVARLERRGLLKRDAVGWARNGVRRIRVA